MIITTTYRTIRLQGYTVDDITVTYRLPTFNGETE